MLTDQRIAEIEERLEKATAGSWHSSDAYVMVGNGTLASCVAVCDLDIGADEERANADFIAHAPSDLRALLDESEQLRLALASKDAVIKEMRDALADLKQAVVTEVLVHGAGFTGSYIRAERAASAVLAKHAPAQTGGT